MSWTRVTAVMMFLLSSACVVSPYDNTLYRSGNTDRYVTFSGYTASPAETVTLQAYHDGAWTTFATTKTSTSPSVTGPWSDLDQLYHWSTTTQIGTDGELWEERATVEIRISSPTSTLWGFNNGGEISCMFSNTGAAAAAYGDCVGDAITTIHLVDID